MLNAFAYLLALTPPAAGASPEDQKRAMIMQFGMIAFMIVIFWVLMIRPQQKKAKEQAALLKTLKSGDKVVTTAGILGVITSVRDDSVTLRSGEAKIDVQKSTVTHILEKGS